MSTRRGAAVLLMLVLAGTVSFAQNVDSTPLSTAIRLYEKASYSEALQALDRLNADAISPEKRPLLQQYRALCFVALDRQTDAAAALDALIASYPDYEPGTDLPPRVRRLFDEASARILPGIVRERYEAARTAYDAAEYTEAAARFEALVTFGDQHRPVLRDLVELARGFRDLSLERAQEAALRSAGQSAAAAPATPVVTPPGVIDQQMPPWPSRVPLTGHRVGLLEIIIARDGTVARAAMREPVHPVYDELLVAAARQWRYTPATQNGRPAAYVKQFRIDVGKGQN